MYFIALPSEGKSYLHVDSSISWLDYVTCFTPCNVEGELVLKSLNLDFILILILISFAFSHTSNGTIKQTRLSLTD